MNIAIIPARGGSKRIPKKNIKDFCGKPVIVWSIEAAIRSDCFDHVIVSTDDKEIANIALEYGAEVPFVRPESLSDDYIGTDSVVAHAVEWYKKQGVNIDLSCCIYATAPFVKSEDIIQGLSTIKKNSCDYVFSVAEYSFPIQRAIRICTNNRSEMFNPEYFTTRSQDLEIAYHDAGQFYWGTYDAWSNKLPIFSSNSIPMILPRFRVQDIDTFEDWCQAELMFRILLQDNSY